MDKKYEHNAYMDKRYFWMYALLFVTTLFALSGPTGLGILMSIIGIFMAGRVQGKQTDYDRWEASKYTGPRG